MRAAGRRHLPAVITFNFYRRLIALEALRKLGVEMTGSGYPTDCKRVLKA